MKNILPFIFLFFSFPAFSQIETKHHLGFSLAIDPASVISIILNENDSDNNKYKEDDDNDGFGAIAAYYKYKPHDQWDFDGGAKLAFTGYEDFEYFHSDIHARMSSQVNLGVYMSINYTTRNAFSDYSGNPFFSSLEIGWAKPQADMLINNIATNEQEKIENLKGAFYLEGKIGFKAGWENNALSFFLSANNMTFAKSANQELKVRGLKEFSEFGYAFHLGISYEFGLRRNEKARRKRARSKTVYPAWFQPEDEKY